jgi:hypothetical protein
MTELEPQYLNAIFARNPNIRKEAVSSTKLKKEKIFEQDTSDARSLPLLSTTSVG